MYPFVNKIQLRIANEFNAPLGVGMSRFVGVKVAMMASMVNNVF